MESTSLSKIANHLKHLRQSRKSAIVFLGAGASVTAKIPTASGILDYIDNHKSYRLLIQDCEERSYNSYMRAMSPGDRKALFEQLICESEINKTHLYLSMLVKAGYIDCIVTTNFDPLTIQSLAIYGIHPSTYDLAVTEKFVTSGITFPSVIYFHGQAHGFFQLNTKNELKLPKKQIKNTISKISFDRTWLIIGYSGNDPVFNQLKSIDKYDYNLYWIGHEEEKPSSHVERFLKSNNGDRFFLPGYDSDSFFEELKAELIPTNPKPIEYSSLIKKIIEES